MLVSVLASVSCLRAKEHGEFEDLGLSFSNSELPPGLYPAVTDSDLPAVSKRGRLVYAMERALKLAYEDGMFRAGDPNAVAVLPLVEIDAGGNSGEVVFVRWPTPPGGAAPQLLAENAERWLLASIRLNPDSVIDVELLSGKVDKDSHHARRITSLVTAADALRSEAPGALFHLLDVYEVIPGAKKKQPNRTVAHVYALSADGDGPDLEAVVDEIGKRGPPGVLSVGTTHPAGKGIADPIVVTTPNPGPLTVTRAMMRGPSAGEVLVITADDRSWVVDARTGEIERPSAPSTP